MKYYKSKRLPKRKKIYTKVYDKVPDNHPETFCNSKLVYIENIRIEKLHGGTYIIENKRILTDQQSLDNNINYCWEETTEEEFNKVLEQVKLLTKEIDKVFK